MNEWRTFCDTADSVYTAPSPDSSVARGNQHHQGRVDGIVGWVVNIKDEAAVAIWSVHRTCDHHPHKVHTILIL